MFLGGHNFFVCKCFHEIIFVYSIFKSLDYISQLFFDNATKLWETHLSAGQ
jgi:hypothetical protein